MVVVGGLVAPVPALAPRAAGWTKHLCIAWATVLRRIFTKTITEGPPMPIP